ncbi:MULTISPECIES: type IX secretion system motor protein PorL/GldL [Hymenobacter]|uniref:Gliding motility protein GldL n=1 Tax=Hymenobacter jejuensis TaxID=2502781 RepID=A0A5B7ZZL3_9BACT|nr:MULTISPECIES: gliding motility protein GldL [Hymenobacter]MBC6991471.1 gliding motility protein GldL [Hymenobacter sp. BT491]QDA59805.1 gliding motility protein GldL [Hymenobacter jejuensis]
MAAKGGSFLFDVLMPKVYGIGAAVVIIGALFKIEHWPFADVAIIAGLGTEAIIFFLSAFQPQSKEPDWSLVYPELSEGYDPSTNSNSFSTSNNSQGLTRKLDDMLKDANVTPEAIASLGQGLNRLSTTTQQLAGLGDATNATDEYTTKVRSAAQSLERINEAYANTAQAMSAMSEATADAKAYHLQVQNVTKNLGALNAVYEMELQDANTHLKSMNKFYGTLSQAMENLTEAGKETDQFKQEVTSLTSNLNSLNRVYGNMLNAMRATS